MISKNSLTPIRDYNNDFFHANDSKLPNLTRVKDGYGGARASYSDSIGGDLDTMDNKIDDRVKKSSNSSVLTDMKNINLREMLKKFITYFDKYVYFNDDVLDYNSFDEYFKSYVCKIYFKNKENLYEYNNKIIKQRLDNLMTINRIITEIIM